MYLQCSSNKSRTATIIFYALCLLYVLSAATVISDLVAVILQPQGQIDSTRTLFNVTIVQSIAVGGCDFIAQSVLVRINHCTYYHPFYSPKSLKIYRCWIVWGQNILVVIIPSFLAVAYLGLSSFYLHFICRFQFIASSYLASSRWRNGT